ncbi:MAG: right-handed parallel beta-helix repeat-containing protein [Armatimonadota bacterium]
MAYEAQSPGRSVARVCRWYGGKKAALSFRFDDSYATHIERAVPMLNRYGMIGTFMVNPGGGDYQQYKATWEATVIQQGHELCNHTFWHGGARTDEEAEQEIGEPAELLHRLQPGLKVIAYNLGGATRWFQRKPISFFEAKYSVVDADALKGESSGIGMSCTECYPSWSVEAFAKALDRAISEGVWFHPHFHGIEPPVDSNLAINQETFQKVLDVVQTHRGDLWQAGISVIYQYDRERVSSRLWTRADDNDTLELSLAFATDPNLYTQPLTMELDLPAEADTVAVTAETGEAVPSRIEQVGAHRVARFEIRPIDMTYIVRAKGVGAQCEAAAMPAPPGRHPYLFFTAADTAALLAKTSDPLASSMWEAILREAGSFVAEAKAQPKDDRSTRYWSRRVVTLGFAYALTHDGSYGAAGVEFLMRGAANDSWYAGKWEMRDTGEAMGALAIGYDWLFPVLTEEQRAFVRDVLVKQGLEPMAQCDREGEWWTSWYRGNWGAVIHANGGLAALAVLGEEPRAADWVRLCERKLWHYVMAMGEDGGWGESGSYGSYAWSNGLIFLASLRRVTGDDLFDNIRLRQLPYWFINILEPDHRRLIPFSNCGLGVSESPEVLALLAREYRDGIVQSAAKELMAQRESADVFAFLWYDPGLAAAPLSDLPTTKMWPDLGWGVMRSSWDDPNGVLLGLKGGQRDWDHQHHDMNSFVLYAYGKPLIVDLHYPMTVWCCETEAHNTIMVAGREQYGKVGIMGQGDGPDPYHRAIVGDAIDSRGEVLDTPWYTRLVGDASLGYEQDDLRSFVREIMYLKKASAADPADYFVMFDDVSATRPVRMDWMLHTYGDITASGNAFSIVQDDAAVDVTVAEPDRFVVESHEKSLDEIRAPKPLESAQALRYIKVRPVEPVSRGRFLSVLIPRPASAPGGAQVTPLHSEGVLGAQIVSGATQDTALFALDLPQISAGGVEAVGRSCFVRRSGGRVTEAALQSGQRIAVDGVVLFEHNSTGHVALRFTDTSVSVRLDLWEGGHAWVHAPRRPVKVLVNGDDCSFEYDAEPASSQRAFYVDPDCAGGGDGSASRPWTALGTSPTNAQWTAINEALAQGPVIVYFSAREAGSDTAEETIAQVNVLRSDKSTNRLTIDGMSKYNADDANPTWVGYAGPCKMRVRITGNEWFSIGVTSSHRPYQYPMNHVTVRGFEATGIAARVVLAGSYVVMEHFYIHDTTKDGATLQFDSSVDSDGTELAGRCTDITFRNNLIERVIGEGIYFGGNYRRRSDGGVPEYGNTSANILLEGNTIRDAGLNGGQGDGLDLKTGLRNVAIRGNVVERCHPYGTAGITIDGVFGDVRSNYLLEGNRISGSADAIEIGGQNGAIIRNNVLHDNLLGIKVAGQPDIGVANRDVQIYNNTVYWNETIGITVSDTDGVMVKNNLVFDNNCRWRPNEGGGPRVAQIEISDTCAHALSDYNLLSAPAPGFEGAHSVIVSDVDGEWLSDGDGLAMNLALRDLHLAPGSRAIDKGEDLSATGFASDFDGVSRPQGRGWDIGAYEWKGSTQ